jgi:transposase
MMFLKGDIGMRPLGSPEALEKRRLCALLLLKEGQTQAEVARKLGCHASAVMRWRRAAQRRGTAGVRAKPASGRPLKLPATQRRSLVRHLVKGPMARGYSTDVWTTKRVAHLIAQEFGVGYHRDHVGKILHRLHWSCQRPDRRALERNEERIERWKSGRWPQVKKTPGGWAPTLPSSTNRASSCSERLAERGRRVGKRRRCATVTNTGKCR